MLHRPLDRGGRSFLALAQKPPDRDGCALRVQLAEGRLSVKAVQLPAAVADDVADQAADGSADEQGREAEEFGNRPGGAERRQRHGAEGGAEHGAGRGEAVAERARATLEARGEALDYLGFVVRLRRGHSVYIGRSGRGLEG